MSVRQLSVSTMNTPTSDMMSAFKHKLFANSVANALEKQRPDLSDQIVQVDEPTVGVQIKLPRDRSVMIGWARHNNVAQWVIATPEPALISLKSGETVDHIATRMIEVHTAFAD